MKKTNLFVDMDGVLAEYHPQTVDHMHNKGFFLNRPVVLNMVRFVRLLINTGAYNVYILSSVIDSPYCVPEKAKWLDEHLPEIGEENRLFVPYGEVKADYVREHVSLAHKKNILLDDYNNNLVKWDLPNALPIKVLNGLNSRTGSWEDSGGYAIKAEDEPIRNFIKFHRIVSESK